MRATLRRSCNACAKAKHGCDLRTPRCSRCIKKNCECVYANEPLTSSPDSHGPSSGTSEISRPAANIDDEMPSVTARDTRTPSRLTESSVALLNATDASFDPFDSYPPTRLPRAHVQRLIHHFLSHIAFQYYPLDLSMESNPFVVSWWPLALADPALFHVSLQTASLDEELRAQKGFPVSEALMLDSVTLLRQKIEDPVSAFQDETLDSVVTLAAIEHGKGNIETSRMHIDGIKRIVSVRGGINELKSTSPLTARMISWVSLLVTGAPQFQTQDDSRSGSGISPIPQWQLASTNPEFQQWTVDDLAVDPSISNILTRLRDIFNRPSFSPLTNTDLHDLTCFVVHKLLLLPPLSADDLERSAISECLRYTTALYMLIIHGTTYYSHADLANTMILQLKPHLEAFAQTKYLHTSMGIWVLSVGLQATIGTTHRQWFIHQSCAAAIALSLQTWEDVLVHLESIFWVRTEHEDLVRQKWEEILKVLAN